MSWLAWVTAAVDISHRALARSTRKPKVNSNVSSHKAPHAIAIAMALVAAALPQTASASWLRVSSLPTGIEPYFVCPAASGRPECDLIDDPTRGSSKRGPVGEGAITTGPELQVSPTLDGNGVEGGYSPENLRYAYGFPSTTSGPGQTVAIVDAYDDPNAESDLKAYRSEYGLPECTTSEGCFRKVNQTGGTSYPAPETSWAKEISLDLDMVSAVCPNCHLLLVEATTNSEENLADAEDEAASLGATEISNSFGHKAPSDPPAIAAGYDHPGITITAAGGDHGYGVNTPASNPHVVAVGGTTLTPASNSRGWTETVWYRIKEGEVSATGSGCSEEAKPSWQTDTGCHFRTTNDVAAVADPNTPVSDYDSYKTTNPWRLSGGTSVATPIIAAAMALANTYTKSFEAAKPLYLEAAANGSGALDDVVSGSNGSCGNYLCEAGPGYDGPSGLGSPYGAPEVPPGDERPVDVRVTEAASSVSQTEATLNATVDPNGNDVTECKFEYGLTTSYGSSASCSSLPGSGTSPVRVSAVIARLTMNTTYHFRISVTDTAGTATGSDATFTTPVFDPPIVVTEAASAITQNTATLNATVNPNGSEVSECEFEYGITTLNGSVACSSLPGSGKASVAVSASLGGPLAADTTYHFRISAKNAGGPSKGSEQAFTTLPNPPTITKLSPKKGPATGETPVIITGTNFIGVTAVKFGTADAMGFAPNSTTSITAVSPAGATGKVDVTVTTRGGTSAISKKDHFTFKKPKK